MKPLPVAFVEQTKSLTADMLSPIGHEALRLLADKGYIVELGLTTTLLHSIQVMAIEPSIMEYCSKDSITRFRDTAAAEHWISRGRAVISLHKLGESGHKDLAGYGWLGPKTSTYVENGQATFALRIGETSQGTGLATPYTSVILDASRQLFDTRGLWLEAWASNAGAIHVYKKLGFTTVSELADLRSRPNGEQVEDTRIFMRLADQA